MNPREAWPADRSGSSLSAVEAHVKADSTTPACRSYRLCDPRMCLREASSERSRTNSFAVTGEAVPRSRL